MQSQEPEKEALLQEEVKKIQLIVFQVGKQEYAVQMVQVKEIVAAASITPVPLAATFLKGLANIRGHIMPVIDLAAKFRIVTEGEAVEKALVLVVESKDYKIGFWIEKMPSSLAIAESQIDTASAIVQAEQASSGYLRGIVKVEQRMVILIDIYALIAQEIEGKIFE
jgi:purine-binding chemotaxis protein CheW